MVTPSHVDIWI